MWLTDPELFLYSKVGGDDVQVWRCKKTMMNSSSPLVVPMVPDDFEYVSQVEDHSDLVDGDILEWEETDYKALVKYISERRLLVNGQGLVIAELSKFSEEDEDEDDQTDVADILLPIIYLRSLDILSLKAYIPDLMEQPIPSRKVQYLEDADGKAAPVVEGGDSTTTTTITTKQVAELEDDLKRERSEKQALAERVADVEAENKKLEAKNVNLNGINMKLKQDLADAEAENKALEAENVNLNGTNTKLKQDLADEESENKALEAKNAKLKQDVAAREDKVVDLESKKKILEEKVTKLSADLVVWKQKFTDLESKSSKTSRDQVERITKLNADLVSANYRESWMNNSTPKSEWVEWTDLKRRYYSDSDINVYVQIVEGEGTEYTVDDGKSNVSANYWSTVQLNRNTAELFKAVAVLKHLGSNSEKAKFDPRYCWYVRSKFGVWYVVTKR